MKTPFFFTKSFKIFIMWVLFSCIACGQELRISPAQAARFVSKNILNTSRNVGFSKKILFCDCENPEFLDEHLMAFSSIFSIEKGYLRFTGSSNDQYDGAPIEKYPDFDLNRLDLSSVDAVVVNGMTSCGHMLLRVGGKKGWYIHIHTFYDYPFLMNEQGYQRYLKENNKVEMAEHKISLPNPWAAKETLKNLLRSKWAWLGYYHNCTSLVEVIVSAGGSSLQLTSHCPKKARFI